MFYKKAVLKNFKKFTGKHICKSLVLSNMTDLPINLFLKGLRRFSANFAKYFTLLFSQSTSGLLLLLLILLFADSTQPQNVTLDLVFYFI